MRSLRTVALTTLLTGAATHGLTAQSLARPGQLAPASNAILQPASYASASPAKIDVQEQRHDRIVNRVWIGSMFALLAGTGMDAATSMGGYERNSLLASSNGKFGVRGITIKAGMAGGVILTEALIMRKHKDMRTIFAIGNFADAALFTGTAVHNLGIKK